MSIIAVDSLKNKLFPDHKKHQCPAFSFHCDVDNVFIPVKLHTSFLLKCNFSLMYWKLTKLNKMLRSIWSVNLTDIRKTLLKLRETEVWIKSCRGTVGESLMKNMLGFYLKFLHCVVHFEISVLFICMKKLLKRGLVSFVQKLYTLSTTPQSSCLGLVPLLR